jgi:tetratricopeptide (TPR) repeat protein
MHDEHQQIRAGSAPYGTANELSATVYGNVIQAGIIHGGVTINEANAKPGFPTPRQLIGPPRGFLNRSEELARLDRMVESVGGTPLIVLVGPAGAGKSALGLQWLYRHIQRFPDGQLFAGLTHPSREPPTSPLRVLAGFLAAMGVPPEQIPYELPEAAALFRTVTAGKRLAVMVDGASSAAQVRPLIPASEHAVTVVTSTWSLAGLRLDGAELVSVGPLTTPVAVELLRQMAGDDVVAEPSAADDLVGLCGRLPLAVRLAGARLAARPTQRVSQLVAELLDERRRLSLLRIRGDASMRQVFDIAYRELPEDASHVYRILGAFPIADIVTGAAAAASRLDVAATEEALETLVDASLLEPLGADRYRLHDLARLDARGRFETATSVTERKEPLDRLIDWYLHAAVTAAATIRPYQRDAAAPVRYPPESGLSFPGIDDALDWLETHRSDLLTLAQAASASGDHARAYELASRLWALWAYRKYYRLWSEFDELGLRCARRLADRVGEAKMLRRLGLIEHDIGRHRHAIERFTQAIALWRDLGEEHRIATLRTSIALARLRSGDPPAAIAELEQALATHIRLGDTRQVALVRLHMAEALIESGRPAEALAAVRQAQTYLAEAPDPASRAYALVLAGRTLGMTGHATEGERTLAEAIESLRHQRSETVLAEAIGYAAELAERTGRRETALEYYRRSRDILRALDLPATAWLTERISGISALAQAVFRAEPDDVP